MSVPWPPGPEEIITKWKELDGAAMSRYFGAGCRIDASADAPLGLAAWLIKLAEAAIEKAMASEHARLVKEDGIRFDGWPEGTDMAREIQWGTGVILADERLHRVVNFMVAGRAQARVERAVAEERARWTAALKGATGEAESGPGFRELYEKAESSPDYWATLLRMGREAYDKATARHAREVERLRAALSALIDAAEVYMKYHNAKFYGGVGGSRDGLNPAISTARAALDQDGN